MNEEQLNSYFELGLIGMVIVTPEMDFVSVNNYLCNMLGYSRNELLKNKWSDLIYPDDREINVHNFNRILSGDIDSYKLEKRLVHRNGSIIDVSIAAKCTRKPDGSVINILSLVQDITEEKKSQLALKTSEERYRSLLENLPVGVFRSTADPDNSFLSVNSALARMFGFENTEAMLRTKVTDCYRDIVDRRQFININLIRVNRIGCDVLVAN